MCTILFLHSFPLLKKRQKPGEGSTAMKGSRRQPPVGFRQRHLMSFHAAAGMPGKTSRVKKHTLSEPVSSSFLGDIAAAELAPADPYDQVTRPVFRLRIFT